MFKKTDKGIVALAAVSAMVLCSCHEDIGLGGKATGGIAPAAAVDTSVSGLDAAKKKPASRVQHQDVTVADLSLTISAVNGDFSQTWTSVADYDPDTKFKLGEYLVEGKYGDVKTEGFNCPAFYGSTTVTVRENETTPANFTATLLNTMISIGYTDAFKHYLDDWDANLHGEGGQYVYFARDEERAAYMAPGVITLNVYMKRPNGQEATLKVAEIKAASQHHYHITVDINNGDLGDAVLVVTFDESLNQEEVRIELSDDLFTAPAPEIKGDGIENGTVLTHIAGDIFNSPANVNIIARGGLQSVKVTTRSTSLLAQGWPAEVDLMAADAAMQSRLTQLGLKTFGIFDKPDKMCVIDFAGVITSINDTQAATSSFDINVVDKMGKTCDPFSFGVSTMPMMLQLENPQAIAVGSDQLTFDMLYNGMTTDVIRFQAYNLRGTWDGLKVISIEPTADAIRYRVTVKVAADNRDVTLRAITDRKTSDAITVQRTAPVFDIAIDQNDVWARKAIATLSSDNAYVQTMIATGTYYISSDGTTFSPANVTFDNGKITFANLNPGTTYTVKATLTGKDEDCCTPVTFTTETANGVPNGNFEDLRQTLSESKMNQGGLWSISAGINYQNTLDYTISEPMGWASVNAKTTSGSTRNSWFVVPSTFNTSLSYSSTVPKIRVLGTGGGTETPDSYKNFSVANGSNAMVVRNVAWDAAGVVPGVWKKEFAGADEYYNHNIPEIANVSAGKLFLGSYSYNAGTETYDEGTLFNSRPSQLTGWYTYTRDANDSNEHGIAEVKVLSGTQVIGTGTATLTPAGTMTKFTADINYVAGAPKATRVCIMLSSSNHASADASVETQKIKVSVFNQRYESAKHGATLVVDNLEFVY